MQNNPFTDVPVFQESSEFGIAVGNVLSAAVVRERGDDVTQR